MEGLNVEITALWEAAAMAAASSCCCLYNAFETVFTTTWAGRPAAEGGDIFRIEIVGLGDKLCLRVRIYVLPSLLTIEGVTASMTGRRRFLVNSLTGSYSIMAAGDAKM
jgi:hypothetical protein